MPKYIEEETVDDSMFKDLRTQEELIATLKRLMVVINSDAERDKQLVAEVGKNNSAISTFMQMLQSLKFELPEIKFPSFNEQVITTCIDSATKVITQKQDTTNKLLQTLIDSRVIEWELKRIESTRLGGIQKVDAKAIKYFNDGR